jgi:hypothetical protein
VRSAQLSQPLEVPSFFPGQALGYLHADAEVEIAVRTAAERRQSLATQTQNGVRLRARRNGDGHGFAEGGHFYGCPQNGICKLERRGLLWVRVATVQ